MFVKRRGWIAKLIFLQILWTCLYPCSLVPYVWTSKGVRIAEPFVLRRHHRWVFIFVDVIRIKDGWEP